MAESTTPAKRVPPEALAELQRLLIGIELEAHRSLTSTERILYAAIWMHGWRTREEHKCPTPPSDQTSPTA